MAAYYEQQQQHIPESSSPRKGIIRLVQHDRSPILSNDQISLPPKPDVRSDGEKASIQGTNLTSDPVRQNSNDERRAYNRQRRKENELNRSRNMDRANVMRREHSAASHNLREGTESGPISLLTRSSPFVEDGSKASGRFARANTNDVESSEANELKSSGRRYAADHNAHKTGEDNKRYHHNSNRGGGNHGSGREVHSRHGGRLNDSDIASISHGGGGGGRSAGGSQSGLKLFDPRKDDPVRFAANRKGLGIASTDGTGSNSVAGMSDSRSLASSATPSMTTASSEGKERRRRRGPGSRATTDSGEGGSSKRKGHGAAEGAISDNNSYVIELKRRYRDVVVLERKLQDEHKLASEQERKFQAEQSSTAQMTSNNSMSRSISNRTNIDRHGFNPDGSLLHKYWLDLIAKHRTLAELHVAFMEAALRPGLPASLHSLPQSYKIPTRLWHTAFHSLLERFRQSLPDWQTCIAMRDTGVPPADREKINEMLDLFTEYIYYAYSYYTNILESELFKVFRSSWIENLGDLARYRMAVAKIMSFVGLRDGVRHGAERRDSGSQSRIRGDRKASVETQLPNSTQSKVDEVDEEALEVASAEMGKDQASIGAAAAQDWDLEEKEIWRSTARGWYAKGLADVPGTGRLHHHLGVLSRDDDLRSLYHFCKSLTASHPYPSARESILPLFERSAQARRISEEASIVDLFVHMHGILFTRIQMDDFDGIYVRFKSLLTLRLRQNDFRNGSDNILLSSSSWMMMATINIAAILQYGAGQESSDDGKSQQSKGGMKVDKATEEDDGEGEDNEDDDEQAEGDDNPGEEDEEEAKQANLSEGSTELPYATQKACRLAFDTLQIVVDAFAEDNKAAANPYITLMLTFFSQECKTEGYLRKLEKFIPWESLVMLGNSIPSSVEPIDPRNEATHKIRSDAIPLPEDWCLRGMAWVGRRVYERGFWKPHKIERLGLRNSLALFENELEMIDRCTRCKNGDNLSDRRSQSGISHSESHQHEDDDENDDDDDDDDEDSENHGMHGSDQFSRTRLTLSLLRWKRIIHALTILIKTVPGMDFEINSSFMHARHGHMVLAPPLSTKLVQWHADEARAEVEGAIGHLNLAALEGRTASPDQNHDASISTQISLTVEDDDDLDEDEVEVPPTDIGDISEEIKELTKRRNELRKQLRIGKAANHYRSSDSKNASNSRQQLSVKPKTITKTSIRIVPGYTTLLLDTNVMLTPTDILSKLIKTKRWMVVIPLSVITELDGLKRREGDVGKRAQDAIKFLETKVKTHSTNLKVQTSRGNYLTDLRFRTEDIDFDPNKQQTEVDSNDFQGHSSESPLNHNNDSKQEANNEDGKCAMARSVDDVILRCLSWQAGSHFRNRLLLLCSNDEERAKRETEIAKKILPSVAKALLVTLDRNLRIKARFQSLSAIGPSELIDLLLEESSST